MRPNTVGVEKHFTLKEIAELWHLDVCTVRDIFRDEPGVLKIGVPHRTQKRSYFTIRIPESIIHKVHDQRSR